MISSFHSQISPQLTFVVMVDDSVPEKILPSYDDETDNIDSKDGYYDDTNLLLEDPINNSKDDDIPKKATTITKKSLSRMSTTCLKKKR